MGRAEMPSLDPRLARYTNWAESRGVAIDGVEAIEIEGRGLGIVANRAIKVSSIRRFKLNCTG